MFPSLSSWPQFGDFWVLVSDKDHKFHLSAANPHVALTETEVNACLPWVRAHAEGFPDHDRFTWDDRYMLEYLLTKDVGAHLKRHLHKVHKPELADRERIERFLVGKTSRSLSQAAYFKKDNAALRLVSFRTLNWPG